MGRGTRSRALACGAVLLAAWLIARPVHATTALVPASLQVALLDRVAYFEHGFRARALGHAMVLVVERRGVAESERVATQLRNAISDAARLGGVYAEARVVAFTSPEAILRDAVESNASVVWFAPGLARDLGSVGDRFAHSGILTVAADGDDVDDGVVLGFELVAARPVIVVNEPQAQRQQVRFSFEVLQRARLIR